MFLQFWVLTKVGTVVQAGLIRMYKDLALNKINVRQIRINLFCFSITLVK